MARQVTNPQNPEVRRTTQNAAVVDRRAYGYKCLNLEVRAIAASSAIYLVTEHRVVRGASPYMSAGVCARRSPDPRLRCPAKPPRVRGARVPPVAVPPVAAAVTGPTRLKLPAGATSSRLGSGGARPQLVTERVAAAAKRPVWPAARCASQLGIAPLDGDFSPCCCFDCAQCAALPGPCSCTWQAETCDGDGRQKRFQGPPGCRCGVRCNWIALVNWPASPHRALCISGWPPPHRRR